MNNVKSAVLLCIWLTILLGGIYPAVITLAAHLLFPEKSQGSLLVDRNGKVTGSLLLGQPFTEDRFFWPRPSSTAGFEYNPLASGGSNFGATHPELIRAAEKRTRQWREAGAPGKIPADLVTASASGLDPHISPAAALLQVDRVAKARNMTRESMEQLVGTMTEDRQFGLLGEPRINVLALNMALERLSP